jgi:PPE-repeat protein
MNFSASPPEINSLRMFSGVGSAPMSAAAAPYAGWLGVAAANAAGAATVDPLLVAVNRNEFVRLVLSNLLGQNAPAIAAAESVYEQM